MRTIELVSGGAIIALLLATAAARPASAHDERPLESPFHVVMEGTGEVIMVTGHVVHPGDEFQSADNRLYQVVRVERDLAYAVFLREIDLAPYLEVGWPPLLRAVPALAGLGGNREEKIGIFHTHTAESFIPTDGKASIKGGGGIIEVGRTFAEALEREGINAVHDRTIHEPHDAAAYQRSRRTATDLMRRGVTMLLDVHRDAAPAHAYQAQIDGETVAQVMIVVGRQNPLRDRNLAWARRLKAAADRAHPGLIRGIFMGRGSYNQDLKGRKLLLEMGSHRTTRDQAERGAVLLAGVIPAVVGVGGGEAAAVWRALGLVLALTFAGTATYLYLATGSWPAAAAKVREFAGREFGDLLRPIRERRGNWRGRRGGDGPG